MLRHARALIADVGGQSYADYFADETLQLATERRLEIIGEAARRVSRDFERRHPEIPWQKIVAHRHVLAHEYGEIDQQ